MRFATGLRRYFTGESPETDENRPMRRSKELITLLALLLLAVALVSWYVIERRRPVRTKAPLASSAVVDITKHDGQTIDFSSGKPELKNTPGDRAALQAGLRDIEAAAAQVIFSAQAVVTSPVPTPTPTAQPPGK